MMVNQPPHIDGIFQDISIRMIPRGSPILVVNTGWFLRNICKWMRTVDKLLVICPRTWGIVLEQEIYGGLRMVDDG